MIKKALAFCMCFCLAFSLGACKKNRFADEEIITPPSQTTVLDQTSTVEESSESKTQEETSKPQEETSKPKEETSKPEEETSKPKEETSKPVDTTREENSHSIKITSTEFLDTEQLNNSFSAAALIHMQLSHNCVPVDWALGPKTIKKDGSANTYFRVSDSRFDSVAELEEYINEFFTPECIKTFYKPENFVDYEGHLYAVSGTGGDDSLLAGCVFKVTKQTTMRVFFAVDIYTYKKIQDKPEQAGIFTKQPKDITGYNVKTVDFVYEISEDKKSWKFSKFSNII